MTFAEKYGPWAVVAGASDGVGAAFAEGLAERGVNVVLVSRRQAVLDEVAAGISSRTGVQTRTLAIDLAQPGATVTITDATKDLEVGCLVYCAGADDNFRPFLASPIETAEAMVVRNCVVPMQLCHHFAPAMVEQRPRRNRRLRLGRGIRRRTQHRDLLRHEGIRHGLRRSVVDRTARQGCRCARPYPEQDRHARVTSPRTQQRPDRFGRRAGALRRDGWGGDCRGVRQPRQRADLDRGREHARGVPNDRIGRPATRRSNSWRKPAPRQWAASSS